MASLTLEIDDDLLRRARVRALEQGRSVDALVCEYLNRFVGPPHTTDSLAAFFEISDRSGASSGPAGTAWTRDELHEH